ncbi:unnamed protein product [Camellia sinensis]
MAQLREVTLQEENDAYEKAISNCDNKIHEKLKEADLFRTKLQRELSIDSETTVEAQDVIEASKSDVLDKLENKKQELSLMEEVVEVLEKKWAQVQENALKQPSPAQREKILDRQLHRLIEQLATKQAQAEGLVSAIYLKEMELERLNGLWRSLETSTAEVNAARNRFGRSNSEKGSLSSDYIVDPHHRPSYHLGGRTENLMPLSIGSTPILHKFFPQAWHNVQRNIILQIRIRTSRISSGTVFQSRKRWCLSGHELQAFTMIGKQEGLKGYWKGNLPQVIHVIPYSVVRLFAYETYKKLLRGKDGELFIIERLTIGAFAGMTSTFVSNIANEITSELNFIVTYPLDVFRLRLVVEPGYKTMFEVALNMLREEGVGSFYTGLGPSLIAIAPYIAVNFCIFDLMKKSLPEKYRKMTETSMVTALLSATLSTVMCFPLDTMRRQMQMKGTPYKIVLDAFSGHM